MCTNVTCANGGTCDDTLGGFKCHCPWGHYDGLTCENGEKLSAFVLFMCMSH